MSDRAVTAAGRLHTENEQLRDRLAALERELAEARTAIESVCRDLTVIEYTCDHVNYDHATATALTNLYLKAKAALEGDHDGR